MLELESNKLEIKFNNAIYFLKFPTVREFKEYREKFKDTENSLDHISAFLSSLGLPCEVCEQLEIIHMNKIVKALTEEKKS